MGGKTYSDRGSAGSPPGLSNLDENMPKPGFSIFMVMLNGCKKNFSKKKVGDLLFRGRLVVNFVCYRFLPFP